MTENATPETEKVPFCKKVVDTESKTVTFTFGNGHVESLCLDDLNDETQVWSALHGISQKGGDSYASAGGDYGFAVASLQKTLQNLRDGTPNSTRGGGTGKAANELVRALAALQGVSTESITELLSEAPAEVLKALRANPAVKAKIAEHRADAAREAAAKAAPVDLSGLLPKAA